MKRTADRPEIPLGCRVHGMSRRRFLTGCAACAGAAGCRGAPRRRRRAEGQAKKTLEADKAGDVDGYIVYQMNCWNRVAQTMATSGKPVLYADFQYAGSGGFLVYTAGFLREGRSNLGFVASSRQH